MKQPKKQPIFCDGEIIQIKVIGYSFSWGAVESWEAFEKQETITILETKRRGKTFFYLAQYNDNYPQEMSEHYISGFTILERTKPHHKTDDHVWI